VIQGSPGNVKCQDLNRHQWTERAAGSCRDNKANSPLQTSENRRTACPTVYRRPRAL
jgi:hypothetical protein